MEATKYLPKSRWLLCVSCQMYVAGGKVQVSHDFLDTKSQTVYCQMYVAGGKVQVSHDFLDTKSQTVYCPFKSLTVMMRLLSYHMLQ